VVADLIEPRLDGVMGAHIRGGPEDRTQDHRTGE